MRTPTTCSFSALACALLAAALNLLSCSSVQAQAPAQEDCKGNECFAPVFDVGTLYQSPVGHYGITELMYAVEINDLAKVESTLASGSNVNAQNDAGATALLMAAAYGSRDIVDRLLAAGANPDIASHQGDTALASAIWSGHAEIAVALLRHGASPSFQRNPDNPRTRQDPLTRAAALGLTDVVALLLERGADVKESGLEALSLALWKHHEDVAALLLVTDIDLNAPTYDTKTHTHMQTGELVLQTAAQQGLPLSAARLLEQGADVNGRNVHGQSALYFAARQNHPEIVRLLLHGGAIVAGMDLDAALDTGNETIANQLAARLDLSTLSTTEIEELIVKADHANNAAILERLFGARDSLVKAEAVTSLVFARADTDNCELVRWDPPHGSHTTLFSSAGVCSQQFFFSKPRAELYVLDDHEVNVISLDAPTSAARRIELPTAMIDEDLAALKERVKVSYGGRNADWLSARVVQVGVLNSNDFAFVTHTNGPADETYAFLYALFNDSWRLVKEVECHRFDPCRSDEVLSHSLLERPGDMTAWSPEMRRNPYFVDKTEEAVMNYDYVSWNGVVRLSIDGQQALLHYVKGESGHCVEDCVYTSALSLELPNRGAVRIANSAGNNAIVDRYALVWTGPKQRSELIDLGTGQSVLGALQVAGWLH